VFLDVKLVELNLIVITMRFTNWTTWMFVRNVIWRHKIMVVTETSLEAYKDLDLGKRQMEVYNIIKKLGTCNNMMIARDLGLGVNQITGRVNELRNKKFVGFAFKDKCPYTKKRTMFWKIVGEVKNA